MKSLDVKNITLIECEYLKRIAQRWHEYYVASGLITAPAADLLADLISGYTDNPVFADNINWSTCTLKKVGSTFDALIKSEIEKTPHLWYQRSSVEQRHGIVADDSEAYFDAHGYESQSLRLIGKSVKHYARHGDIVFFDVSPDEEDQADQPADEKSFIVEAIRYNEVDDDFVDRHRVLLLSPNYQTALETLVKEGATIQEKLGAGRIIELLAERGKT